LGIAWKGCYVVVRCQELALLVEGVVTRTDDESCPMLVPQNVGIAAFSGGSVEFPRPEHLLINRSSTIVDD